jgi:hypothetical protein
MVHRIVQPVQKMYRKPQNVPYGPGRNFSHTPSLGLA